MAGRRIHGGRRLTRWWLLPASIRFSTSSASIRAVLNILDLSRPIVLTRSRSYLDDAFVHAGLGAEHAGVQLHGAAMSFFTSCAYSPSPR
jgi:hypothetical protein